MNMHASLRLALGALCTGSLLLGGCQSQSPSETDSTKTSHEEQPALSGKSNKENKENSESSAESNGQKVSTSDSSKESQKNTSAAEPSQAQSNENDAATTPGTPVPAQENQNTAQSASPAVWQSEIEGKLSQAISDQGFTVVSTEWKQTETGNLECILQLSGMNANSTVWLTFFADYRMPQDTFEANTAADQAMNMPVQNEWSDNGNTVRVLHNNMADGNYVEVLDEKQRLTLHCANSVPEQLNLMLRALQSLGFPAQI